MHQRVRDSESESLRKRLRVFWAAMHAGEPTAAIEYLKCKRKGQALDTTRLAEAEALLREWWGCADAATRQVHRDIDDSNEKMHSAIKQARRFIVDLDLEAWVENQNIHKGITPGPALLLRHATVVKARLGVESPKSHNGARRWMQRWRARCGLMLRSFPALERLSVAQMHSKARHQAYGKAIHEPDKMWTRPNPVSEMARMHL